MLLFGALNRRGGQKKQGLEQIKKRVFGVKGDCNNCFDVSDTTIMELSMFTNQASVALKKQEA